MGIYQLYFLASLQDDVSKTDKDASEPEKPDASEELEDYFTKGPSTEDNEKSQESPEKAKDSKPEPEKKDKAATKSSKKPEPSKSKTKPKKSRISSDDEVEETEVKKEERKSEERKKDKEKDKVWNTLVAYCSIT